MDAVYAVYKVWFQFGVQVKAVNRTDAADKAIDEVYKNPRNHISLDDVDEIELEEAEED